MSVSLAVLGMHRSGTSALAGALHLLGVPLGEPLVPAGRDNERGFWELAEVVEIHEDLLAAFGASHLDLTKLPDGWLASEAAREARGRLLDVLRRNFEGVPLWAVKDPRLSIFLPLWDEVIRELGIESRFVLMQRSPWEVARSLATRNATGTREALALWERHVAEAERATRGRPRAFASYERLLAEPVAELERLGRVLGVVWPAAPAGAREKLAEFLSSSLRHWKRPALPRDADEALAAAVREAEEPLERLSTAGETPEEIATLERALAALRRAAAPPPPPRRVLFISHDATRTGAPLVLLALIRRLVETRGIEPRIVLRGGGPLEIEFRALGDTVLAPHALPDPRFCDGVSLVWANTATNGAFLAALSREDLPVVTHVHELSYALSAFGREALPALVRRTTRFVAVSQAVRENLVRNEGVPPEKVTVVYGAVDTAALAARSDPAHRAALRRVLGLPPGTRVVLGAGTADWRKGTDLFLQIARSMTERRKDVAFVWMGSSCSPLEEIRHAYDLERLGRSGRVFLLGERTDPVPVIAAADVLLLTSREDPFPVVMMEAAAFGIPSICFDESGGAPELCREAGVVVPYLDLAAMEREADSLLSDEARRGALGEAARRRVVEHHDFELLVGRCAALIDELALAEPPAAASRPPELAAGPLPEGAYRLEWVECRVPERAMPGEAIPVEVAVRNAGASVWPDRDALGGSGAHAVRLAWRWWDSGGAAIEVGARADLPYSVAPGETVRLRTRVAAPLGPGVYRLQLDLLQELVAWFESKGAPRLERTVSVE